MATIESALLQAPAARRQGRKGPVTVARQRRTATIYAALCALGLLPLLVHASAAWQAAGLGLWMPGAGFVAVGGLVTLLFPLTLALFALSLVAWFWAGAVVVPVFVWAGSAALAAALAGPAIWIGAPLVVPLCAAATAVAFRRRAARRSVADRQKYETRAAFLPGSLVEVAERSAVRPAADERELSADDLAAVRYALDRGLQPRGRWDGFDVIEQFQPAALRYQLNHLGFALGLVRCHYTPSFSGHLAEAQRNLIERYLERKVWGYWVYESCWGHLNFRDFDPAGRDNIMLTGWFGMHVGQYLLASGDRRYAEPGSLTFRLNSRTAYAHDFHTLVESVVKNFESSAFCLFPCEPNWVYPICNHYGMTALAVHDRLFGTRYVAEHLPRWLEKLDSEFTDESGSIIGLRSSLTGLEAPFPTGEVGYAAFANCFAPERAQRLWAIAREELQPALTKDANGETRITLPAAPIDFGNYRRGFTGAYGSILIGAREFGDTEIAEAALRSLDQDCGLATDGGVRRYARGSNLSNAFALQGRLLRTGDFRASFAEGPPPATATGPLLAEAPYPDVLVAKARSHGDDLDLVLHPGGAGGRHAIRIERLRPGARYELEGGQRGSFSADARGQATLELELRGRTPLRIVPRG